MHYTGILLLCMLQGSLTTRCLFSLQLDLFDSLFEANGRKALLFYYQLADAPASGKTE